MQPNGAWRRGFFLHSDTTGEPDTGEHENPEGFIVRLRIRRSPLDTSPGAQAPLHGFLAAGRPHLKLRSTKNP
jgi:hypothetical protein